jgi:hypothetical protein
LSKVLKLGSIERNCAAADAAWYLGLSLPRLEHRHSSCASIIAHHFLTFRAFRAIIKMLYIHSSETITIPENGMSWLLYLPPNSIVAHNMVQAHKLEEMETRSS